ncbi:hypothetical protein LTR16_000418, partial [Cryomyces antarcticus]
MAGAPIQEFFEHLVGHQLAICKRCGHAVWPEQIEGHLTGKQHKMKRKKAVPTTESVRGWPGLIQYSSELRVPDYVEQPISQLPLHQDGLLCQLDPTRCRYVCRDSRTIKWHWRQVHEWSVGKKRGRPAQSKGQKIEERSQEAVKRVQCRRFFPSRHGSQYFGVRQPGQEHTQAQTQAPGEGGNSREEIWAKLRQKLIATRTSIEDKARSTIQEGELDEVNPWLERAQWHRYLVGLERPELMSCVEEPVKEEEPVEAVVWETMDGLVRFCQQSVQARVGVFVRMEAIRTEKHQTRYQPLQPYMDEKGLGDYSRPWKQVLMFFARTQKEHGWRSPKYRFTGRQREAWEELVDQAERRVNGEEMAEEEGSHESEESAEDAQD